MAFNIGITSGNDEARFGSYGRGNGFENRAQMFGINISDFYEIDANGEKVLNYSKLMKAMNDAESTTNKKNAENASQSDSFARTTETKAETKEVETEKETIEKEYTNAYVNFFNQMNTGADANQQSKDAEKAWAEIEAMQFNLTKEGVKNTTVIAGASEFITKLEEAVSIAKAGIEEEKEISFGALSVDEQDNENANLFANNPFFASLYEANKKDGKEIAIA